jgi:hypothetical protein
MTPDGKLSVYALANGDGYEQNSDKLRATAQRLAIDIRSLVQAFETKTGLVVVGESVFLRRQAGTVSDVEFKVTI